MKMTCNEGEPREPRELSLLREAKRALQKAGTVHEAKDIRDKAEAVRCYMRQVGESLEAQNFAAEVKLRAERRAGELLAGMEKNRGGGDHRSHDVTSAPTLADIGIQKMQAHRWQTIAALPEGEFEQHVEGVKEAGRELTSAGVFKAARQWVAQQPTEPEVIDVPPQSEFAGQHVVDLAALVSAGARFRTVYADPPWRYGNQATRSATGNHYATMSVEEICAEPVAALVEDDAHLHLWTTNAFLFDARLVIEAWGFTYKSCFVWVKPQMGIGNYWRVSHEFMLLGTRGRLPFEDRGQMSWAAVERTKHSRKPREIRERVEAVSPGPYLEMYGRESMPAPWTVYGNQIERGLLDG